jgi:hypothetical protein
MDATAIFCQSRIQGCLPLWLSANLPMSSIAAMRHAPRMSVAWLLLGCILASGCAWPDWRGPGFKDEPKIGRRNDSLFPANKGNSAFGFSTKAQQIERNLGVE